jgi:hypothetical protein
MDIQIISKQHIDDFQRLLTKVPSNPLKSWQRTKRPTKTKFVAELAADVIRMRRKGYSSEEIAALISAHLFEISANCLRSLLNHIGVSMRVSRLAYLEINQDELQGDTQSATEDFIRSLLEAREVLLSKHSGVPDFMDVLLVSKLAQGKLKRLPLEDAALFRHAVMKLEPGQQTVQIAEDSNHIAQKLVAAGLFHEYSTEVERVYQIPEGMARIVRVPKEARAAF